jgi:hypothetical protein
MITKYILHNITVRSRNGCCLQKPTGVTHSERVSVAYCTHVAKDIRRIILAHVVSLSASNIFFNIVL